MSILDAPLIQNPKKRPLVIYHGNCTDGFTAAWVAHRFFGPSVAEFYPAFYAQPAPECTGRDVYILDFSYKRPVMLDIMATANNVVILDHHKTAQEDLDGLVEEAKEKLQSPAKAKIVFDMEKSGARLASEYFFPGFVSMLVQYVEDRDLWRFRLPKSRQVNSAIHSYEFGWETWTRLHNRLEKSYESLATEGEAIERLIKSQVRKAVYAANEIEIDGHRVLAVNATVNFSEVAGELAEGRPFGAAWFIRKDGKRQWSLRSRDGGIDVSEIAKKFGGGGHRNAAGFEEDIGIMTLRRDGVNGTVSLPPFKID